MIVPAPDGKLIDFGDLPGDQVDTEMKKMYPDYYNQYIKQNGAAPAAANQPSVSAAPPQKTGTIRYLEGAGSALLKGADIGFGMPGNLALGATSLADRLTGADTSKTLGPVLPPTSAQLLDTTGRLGLTDRADLVPGWGEHPVAERLGAATLEGIGSAIPQAGLDLATGGSLAPVISAATTLGTGGAGALAAQGVKEAWPGAPNELAPVIGATVGGVAQAGKSLLSGSTVERVAKNLGESKTLQDAGGELQDSARQWRAIDMPAKQDQAWTPVDHLIPGDTTPVPLTNFETTLKDITSKGGALQPLIKLLTPQLPTKLLDTLQNKTTVGLGVSGVWNDAKTLRSALGNAMSDPKLVNDIGEQNIQNLYRATTADMKTVAAARGAGDEFDAANTESTRLYNLANGPMSRVIKSDTPSATDPKPEDVASRLLSGGKRGASDLAALRAEIPDGVDELAAAHLRVNPESWNKMSPEAKLALVPNDRLRAVLDRATPQVVKAPAVGPSTPHIFGGGALGVIGGHFIEPSIANEAFSGAVGEAAGLAYPWIKQGVKAVIKNPNLLALPYAGGVGASDQLYPNPNMR